MYTFTNKQVEYHQIARHHRKIFESLANQLHVQQLTFKIKFFDFQLLDVLNDQTDNSSTAAKLLFRSLPEVSRRINFYADCGLIKREHNFVDRRAITIRLTAAGKVLLAKLCIISEQADNALQRERDISLSSIIENSNRKVA